MRLSPHRASREKSSEDMTSTILALIEHYAKTGEIQDALIPYFKQSGRWVGDCRNWEKSTYRMASATMHSAVLPESRRTALNDQGKPILRTSFHWRKRRDVEIPWFEINGSIKIKSLEKISAPNLRSVGGYIYSCTDSEVCLPNLQRVGGDLDFQGTRKLHVPQLSEVGGSLLVVECGLPNLETVGNRFWGIWTGRLFVPKLRSVGGSFEIGMAESVIVPALEWVCFDIVLTYFTTTFVANSLVEVGGSLHAGSATIFHAAALRHVGDALYTNSAPDFYRPEFEDLALVEMHPDAERRWKLRGAVRALMRNMPIMDI